MSHHPFALQHPLQDKIAATPLGALARATGFRRRASGKITPAGFLRTCCLFALQTQGSLSAFARLWACNHGQTLSKQAVKKRFCSSAVAFLQAVLQRVLASQVLAWAAPSSMGGLFNRILLQDSTCLALPPRLAGYFPGPANNQPKKQASLKIQATLDVKKNQWVQFQLTPYVCNDQGASASILEWLQKGDLVIRDLGYFVLDVLDQIQKKGAFFLTRWRYGVLLFCPRTGVKLSLAQLLGSADFWEGEVLLGSQRLPVRLMAQRMPPAVVKERRQKARQQRDLRLNHSPDYLHLLGWNIFLSNVPATMLGAQSLIELYSWRWRLEIIFKAWKSHFALDQFTAASAQQVLIVVLSKLIWICWFSILWNQLANQGANISMLKLAQCWSQWATTLWSPPHKLSAANLTHLILYYSRYEKRKDRRNFLQQCASLG
jgi:hypothetical protein